MIDFKCLYDSWLGDFINPPTQTYAIFNVCFLNG